MQLFRIKRNADRRNGRSWSVDGWQIFYPGGGEGAGTGVTLYRMLEDNVPTKEEFLQQKMENGQTLGFDGRVVDTRFGLKLEKDLADKQIKNRVWQRSRR